MDTNLGQAGSGVSVSLGSGLARTGSTTLGGQPTRAGRPFRSAGQMIAGPSAGGASAGPSGLKVVESAFAHSGAVPRSANRISAEPMPAGPDDPPASGPDGSSKPGLNRLANVQHCLPRALSVFGCH